MNRVASRITLSVLMTLAALSAGTPSAVATPGFIVQAGAAHPTDPTKPFEYTRFYPETLQVHRGQAVLWKIVGGAAGGASGFHTVTFMPADGPDRPGFLRGDEVAGYDNLVEDWWRPSSCGHAGQPSCVLSDTDTFLSSGIPPFNPGLSFSVVIDLPAGSYDYVCTVHASMKGQIEVVSDEVPVPTQAEVDQQRATEIAVDTANAEALQNQDPGFTLDGDRKIWNVLLGDSTADNHVAINQYIPASLEIEAGDRVHFAWDEGVVDELHTVSFPGEAAGDFSLLGTGIPWGKGGFGFFPRCDPDDPLTGAPGVPGLFGVTPLPCPGTVEMGVSPWMTSPQRAPNDLVLPGIVHDSGLMAPAGAPDTYRALPAGGFLPTTFEAEFPAPGSYVYECQVHSDPMTGGISVT